MKKIFYVLISIIITGAFFNSYAKEINFSSDYSNAMFRDFATDFGVGMSFNPMSPAENLGVTGFDVSLEAVVTVVDDGKDYWKKAFKDKDAYSNGIPVGRIHIQKGLPWGIDLGGIYGEIPDSEMRVWGLELKHALIKGNAVTPAVSIRGTFTQLEKGGDLSINTKSLDASISKGFAFITPYATAMATFISAKEKSDNVDLDNVNKMIFAGYIGVQITPFPFLVSNLEIGIGQAKQAGLKLGVRF